MTSRNIIFALQSIDESYIHEAKNFPSQQHRPPARIAICAACLSALLFCTALAVSVIHPFTSLIQTSNEGTIYEVDASITKHPLSSFSSQLRQASESRGSLAVVQIEFDSLTEVQDFIGPSIDIIWPDISSWKGVYCVTMFHTQLDKLWAVSIESIDYQLQTSISIFIYTEYYKNDHSVKHPQVFTSESAITMSTPYQMANGLTADIISIEVEEKNSFSCAGTFTNGSLYSVEVFGPPSKRNKLISQLHATLDRFQ